MSARLLMRVQAQPVPQAHALAVCGQDRFARRLVCHASLAACAGVCTCFTFGRGDGRGRKARDRVVADELSREQQAEVTV